MIPCAYRVRQCVVSEVLSGSLGSKYFPVLEVTDDSATGHENREHQGKE